MQIAILSVKLILGCIFQIEDFISTLATVQIVYNAVIMGKLGNHYFVIFE